MELRPNMYRAVTGNISKEINSQEFNNPGADMVMKGIIKAAGLDNITIPPFH